LRLAMARFGRCAGLGLAMVWVTCAPQTQAFAFSFKKHKPSPDATHQKPAEIASQPPAFSIPVEPLGFFAPGQFYLGQREALVSLDFLDENRLLFTFRAPGLLHRTGPSGEDERQVRAVVLTLPNGATEAESLWTLHGVDRYLWALRNGHFLLRDGDTLKEGSASLELKPLLQFPGPLLWLQMDPAQQYLVTDSREPQAPKPDPNKVGSPSTAEAGMTSDGEDNRARPDIVVRILRRSSGEVMLVSHVRTTVRLPINSDGYVEALRGNGRNWILNMNLFTGGTRVLGRVDSACEPPIDFLSGKTALVNACLPQTGRNLVAVSTEGLHLWSAPSQGSQIWPLLIPAPDGSLVARETISLDHSVDAFTTLIDAASMKGQLVEVFDSKNGKRVLKAPADPILDAGGNVAISPSGKLIAVLNAGAIQIYDLSVPPPASGTTPH
jgi:hypothetical protein